MNYEKALKTLDEERSAWEDGRVWVTDKVGFDMKETIKKARKTQFQAA